MELVAVLALFGLLGSAEADLQVNSPFEGLLQLAKADNVSSLCQRHLNFIDESIENKDMWALKMFDSSGQPTPGFIFGNNFWLGSLTQCEDINLKPQNGMTSPLQSHYIVAYFRHNATIQELTGLQNEDLVTLGLCLPRSCDPVAVHAMLSTLFGDGARPLPLMRTMDVSLRLTKVRGVEDNSDWLLSFKFITVMSLLGLALALCIAGWIYDQSVWQPLQMERKLLANKKANNNEGVEQFHLLVEENQACKLTSSESRALHYKQSWVGKVLMCFSVSANTKILMEPRLSSDSIKCIHGLRFLGMGWIIMVHTIFYLADYADNRVQAFRMAEGFAVQVVANSTLSVDTFFFISGFLVAYLYYKGEKKCKAQEKSMPPSAKFILNTKRFFLMVAKRFIRLTPVYMMMVGILDVNQTKYSRTSVFHTTENAHETCSKYWWRNLLYINNLFSRDEMCMTWSWYIANDMQFFVIASFLLLLSTSYRRIAFSVGTLLTVASCAITAYISWSYNYVPTLSQQYNMLNVLYDPPWTRIGPYMIGMLTGYYVNKINGRLSLKTWQVACCWFLGSMCNVVVLFGLTKREISPELGALYVGLSRTVWGVGLAWIVVACVTKHGGIVAQVLEFPGWVPMSRLTYCAYLLNPFLMNSASLGSEKAYHVDFLPLATDFFGNMGMCYFCAYVLTLLFESPNVLLMRLATERNPRLEK
ncbi:nose resistant to fluoxetine protein 6-like [Neocloeon triangulifer]|uniref:nose resistant to fluoxetine protein 6-like n=1 Tax=Neocloeon triangulifer TaxID=2078957 RepID=UPI00286F9FE7|nr:nose resistant to fluoxetine protein 6-like [Neocloeon triangulifer]